MAADNSEQLVLLNRLADEFAARYRKGERPALQEYIDRHPELADDIREFFPAMVEIEHVKENQQEPGQEPVSAPALAVQQFGEFRIIREVGRGGMGIVYEAEQVSLGRHVALKVLPKSLLPDTKAKRRFEREAKAAARLHHTNIVPVFGTGEHDGTAYYVMQFIQGTGLDVVIDELARMNAGSKSLANPALVPTGARSEMSAIARSLLTGSYRPADDAALALTYVTDVERANKEWERQIEKPGAGVAASPSARMSVSGDRPSSTSGIKLPGQADSSPGSSAQRLTYWQSVARVGVQVADALAYAHKQGIIHRDVKPSNLLLDLTGTVWVTDFGLAKADDQPNLTHAGDIIGTLRYMPPEAFDGQSDARGDIYSLGLTLYELTTLRPAFPERDRKKLVKQLTSSEAAPLSQVRSGVPRDLETIIHKAIDREPDRRYQRAEDLAEDLRRFLEDRPVKARRISDFERLVRWARRNRAVAAALVAIGLLLIGVAIASTIVALRFEWLAGEREVALEAAEISADEARQRGDAERWQRYRANVAAAAAALALPNTGAARRALAAAPEEYRDWEWRHFNCQLDNARAVLQTPRQPPAVAVQLLQAVLKFYQGGRQIVAGSPDGAVHMWDTATGREVGALRGPGYCTLDAVSGQDGRLLVLTGDWALRSWDSSTNEGTVLLRAPNEGLWGQLLSPDGRLLLGTKDSVVVLWDVSTGQKRAELPGKIARGESAAVFSADGRHLAYSTDDMAVHLWDVAAGAEAHVFRGPSARMRTLSFSPDGKRLAAGVLYPDNSVRVWSVPTGEEIAVLRGHRNEVNSVAFSPNGSCVASTSSDQTARVWDVASGTLIAALKGHTGIVRQATFSPDGKRVVTASHDETLRLWDTANGSLVAVLRGHTGAVWAAAYSPDGSILASWSPADPTVRLWDMAQLERNGVLRGHASYVYDVAFSPDGTQALSTAWDGTARLWDPTTGREIRRFQHGTEGNDRIVAAACFRPDGRQFATVTASGALTVWDVISGQKVRSLSATAGDWRGYPRAAFEPSGKHLAVGSGDGAVRLWDDSGDVPIAVLRGHEGPSLDVAFSSSGTQLASVGVDGTVRLWDIQTRSPLAVLRGHGTGNVDGVAYSPDGRLLASASHDKTVRVWDTATRETLAVLPHGSSVYSVAFSPDGRRLAAGCADNSIRLWDVGVAAQGGGKELPEAEVAELRGHDDYVHAVAWSPDGTRLASASGDQTVRIWDSLPAALRARPKDTYLPPKGYVAYRASSPIQVDGKLDDEAWQAVPWTDDFVDIEGDLRIKPRFRTRVKMLWDDQYLYIGAELEEPHVQGTFTKHDSYIFHEDNDFEVFINPDGSNHNYAELEMNALNTTWDLRLKKPYRDGGRGEDAWEIPGLKTAVHVNGTINNPRDIDQGWTIEIAIPWQIAHALDETSQLAGRPQDGDQWRINFSRVEWRFDVVNGKYVRRKDRREDNWVWSPQGAVNMHQPETWGYVQFSTAPPGKASFRPDPAGPAKHLLHQIYYAQSAFRKEHGHYAKTLAELRLSDLTHESLAAPLRLETTGTGFQATAEARSGGKSEAWHIREDSRVWREGNAP